MTSLTKRASLRSMLALPLGLLGLGAVARTASAATTAGKAAPAGTVRGDLAVLAARQDITEARLEITQVVHRYARAVDRVDEDLLRSCFWPDSTHQHGGFKGKSQDFAGIAIRIVGALKTCSHLITNVSIEVSGDKAVAESYFLSHHRRTKKTGGPGEEDWFLKGRYLDRFEKRDGVWKIAHRRGLHDFSRLFDPADTSLDAAPAEQLSARKPDDPLYAMLAELHGGA
jgi:hypothetical protein